VITGAERTTGLRIPTATGPLCEPLAQVELAAFLFVEAEALDDRRYDDWLALVTEDFSYQVPVPVLHDNPVDPSFDPRALLIDETRQSLMDFWFARLQENLYEIAWGDHPPVRQRRFVSNVRARAVGDGFVVRSNLRLRMIRQFARSGELTAERFDRVVRDEGGLRLASRVAVLDDLILESPQVRVVL